MALLGAVVEPVSLSRMYLSSSQIPFSHNDVLFDSYARGATPHHRVRSVRPASLKVAPMFHAARDASGGTDSATSTVVIDLTEPESCDIIGVDVSVDVEDLLDHDDDDNTAEIIVLDEDDEDGHEVIPQFRDSQIKQSAVLTKGEIESSTNPRVALPFMLARESTAREQSCPTRDANQPGVSRNGKEIQRTTTRADESTLKRPALEMVHDPVQSRIQPNDVDLEASFSTANYQRPIQSRQPKENGTTPFDRRDASRPNTGVATDKPIPPVFASHDPPSWLTNLVKAELLTTESSATKAGKVAGNPSAVVNKPKSRHVGPSDSARAPAPLLVGVNASFDHDLPRKQPTVKAEICAAESSEQAIPNRVEVAPVGKRPDPELLVSLSASIQQQGNEASCPLAPPTIAATAAACPVSRGDVNGSTKMARRIQLPDQSLANETALSVARQTEDWGSPTIGAAGQTPAVTAPTVNKPATDNIRMQEERPSETALAAAAVPVVKAEIPFAAPVGGCNFIVIDDSSDDENYCERPRIVKKRGRPPSSTTKRKCASAGSKATNKRYRQGSYSPWSGWNIHFSEHEALHLQERMLKEAATRMAQQSRIHNPTACETRPGRIGIPAIAKPLLDVATLYPEHWQWKEPYACLGLPLDSPFSAVKAQYRRLARIYHPDKSKHSNAAARFHGIARAYQKLCCNE
jgi:DnaJ domain